MELPIFKCVIDESLESKLGVSFVALVDRPAIDKNFLAFNKELKFNIDEDKRIVSGPAMLAGTLLYRKDEQLGEYYAMFDAAGILCVVQKFFKLGYGQNFNIMHDPEQKTSGITIFESFITNTARGIMPMKGYEDAPEGSWFLSAKVDDDAAWAKVKAGDVKGFSVEGLFKQVPVKPVAEPEKLTEEQVYNKILDLLRNV